jgi:hypothetical protein
MGSARSGDEILSAMAADVADLGIVVRDDETIMMAKQSIRHEPNGRDDWRAGSFLSLFYAHLQGLPAV